MNRAVFIERRAARILQNAKDDPKTAIVGLRWINLAIDRLGNIFAPGFDNLLFVSLMRMREAITPIAEKALDEAGR